MTPETGTPQIQEKHALWLRLTHWLNVPTLALMVWSGILIYWANDVYPGFFPKWFYETFSIEGRLAEGLMVHFTVAWIFAINGMIYAAYLAVSGHWRELVPTRASLRDLWPSLLHDLGLRHEVPPGQWGQKFNPMQRIAYTSAMILGALEVLSGIAIYKPVQLGWLAALLGGYEWARLIHFVCMISLVGFVLVHVAQVARAGWNNFRAMVAGFEVTEK